MTALGVKVSTKWFLFVYQLNFCVGFSAPIDFNLGSLTHLLAETQLTVHKVMDIFTRRYDLPLPSDGHTAELRKEIEESLIAEVLPQLDVTVMSLSAMERNFGDHIYINNSTAAVPQCLGTLTEATP